MGFLGLGGIALTQGAFEEARCLLLKGIGISRDTGKIKKQVAVDKKAFELAYGALSGAALLLVDSGEIARVIEMYALAAGHPTSATRAIGRTWMGGASPRLLRPCLQTLWSQRSDVAGRGSYGLWSRSFWSS
jgi:hypothetical protein